MFEEVCKSTFEEEQLLVNIDSGANRIIIKTIHLFDQLNRLRKSTLRTASGQPLLQAKGIGEIRKCDDVKVRPGRLGASNFCVETYNDWL